VAEGFSFQGTPKRTRKSPVVASREAENVRRRSSEKPVSLPRLRAETFGWSTSRTLAASACVSFHRSISFVTLRRPRVRTGRGARRAVSSGVLRHRPDRLCQLALPGHGPRPVQQRRVLLTRRRLACLESTPSASATGWIPTAPNTRRLGLLTPPRHWSIISPADQVDRRSRCSEDSSSCSP